MSLAPTLAAALPERLTMAEARATLARLQPVFDGAQGDLALDATALRELDSAALAVLLHGQRTLQARGHRLQLVGAPGKLGELARMYGVAPLLGLD
ncbi:STAS domain-containing protein [Pseudaquabacterium rugosum]|jgi:phospholipid transport system transporter-binding protein|uniref:STAS domain-containing protein n=1 Tax=Pseudaquabacterium rugosum TaxID=2984194 RepID=A0ABU9B4A2_9BURK